MITLGLDIGTNSVGSAWVDDDPAKQEISAGVSVFPAGVDEKDDGRGAPKNQARRQKRSLRRSLARRSARKRKLRKFLVQQGLLPVGAAGNEEQKSLFASNPWALRRKALHEPLTPYEFGRVVLHLCQRRGAAGLKLHAEDKEPIGDDGGSREARKKTGAKSDDSDEGPVKQAIEGTKRAIKESGAETFGEYIAILMESSRHQILDKAGQQKRGRNGQPSEYFDRVRNERDQFKHHADRAMLREEFQKIWNKQRSLDSPLARLLTDSAFLQLDNPQGDKVWRHRGLLFGQRRTYWNLGTLGRCDLEPTDQCVAIADSHAGYFRVLETANNIRLRGPGEVDFYPLMPKLRDQVITRLRSQKTADVKTVRGALGIDKRSLIKSPFGESDYALNIERDEDREINTDWFHRAIVINGVGEQIWGDLDEKKREGLNRAVLRFDPAHDEDEHPFRDVLARMGLPADATSQVIAGWRTRPKLERRLKLSRRAIMNLIPYMENQLDNGRWPTQIEARQAFATDPNAIDQSSGKPPSDDQRRRYQLDGKRMAKRDRIYLKKHPEAVLPPAPMLANPVVRKAIHEVRRHVIAHIRAHGGRKPDRIVIEFARETTKPAKVSDRILATQRRREKIRKEIREETIRPAFGGRYVSLSANQLRAAEDRVILCMQQRSACAYSVQSPTAGQDGRCAYSGRTITLAQAAVGRDLEVDHIIPYSRCGDNSMNNRVLCYRDSNRDKGQQTPREWWGEDFDQRSVAIRFMDGHEPEKGDYFSKREYAAKWRNFSNTEVPREWKGSQLSDTAYAAVEVQAYLHQSLWPDEPGHIAKGAARRIMVTKGAYTSLLRRDWQLYETVLREGDDTPENERRRDAKNRGDHREHAVDAVAIALTDGERIAKLAAVARQREEERAKAKLAGRDPRIPKRPPLEPPWGSVESFRRQVLSLIYGRAKLPSKVAKPLLEALQPIVVSHRAVGRRLTDAMHEETLFGPVPTDSTLFIDHKPVADLEPNHLRVPRAETKPEAIERLANHFVQRGIAADLKQGRKRAKEFVESRAYTPRKVDPPPGKPGLVRDIGTRRLLRRVINERLIALGIPRNANDFTDNDIKRILKETGPITMRSGVPIKRVARLRTMNDPVIIRRKFWDEASGTWKYDESPRASRAYVGGNNHHIEIREGTNGRWSGDIVPTFIASTRARIEHRDPVDRSDKPDDGGRFVMSLSQGEIVYMREKTPLGPGEPDYFVVFKLDKPQTIQLKRHWDARRATGEKDESGVVIPDSVREEMAVPASQFKDLAPPGETTPIKVVVSPLGQVRRVEPHIVSATDLAEIDPRIVALAREALEARAKAALQPTRGKRRHGSWSWLKARLKRDGLAGHAPELSAAMRLLSPRP